MRGAFSFVSFEYKVVYSSGTYGIIFGIPYEAASFNPFALIQVLTADSHALFFGRYE